MKKLSLVILLMIPLLIRAQPTKEQIKEVENAKREVRKMKGEPFPTFQLTTLDGEIITSDQTKGKILLINFWFTRCSPCVMEMSEMNDMVAEYRDEEILFLAPTFDDSELVNSFLSKKDFDYTIIPDVRDFCKKMNIRSYPTHFVINKEGIIEKVIIGYSVTTVGALRKSIRKLLKTE